VDDFIYVRMGGGGREGEVGPCERVDGGERLGVIVGGDEEALRAPNAALVCDLREIDLALAYNFLL